jgi:hypothetical protein
MPYAERDEDGQIVALHAEPTTTATEEVSADNAEVVAFLFADDSGGRLKDFLSVTDTELARVVEDLVDLMIAKNLILFTELPEAARQKLISRRRARDSMHGEDDFMVEEKDIL